MTEAFDIAVVGGGINGAGIARDAAGRGLRVLLVERGDLASATSQASSKLIHGGLRYLEHFEFRLVREALHERELLLANAPHLVRPMRFVLPAGKRTRPAWILRAGLLLYDALCGSSELPQSERIDLHLDERAAPLRDDYRVGFTYSDCFVDDARLVVLTARDAADRGAIVRTRCECQHAKREDNAWVLSLESHDTTETVRARTLINSCGPWVRSFLDRIGVPSRHNVRLVKGSHIVVPRLYEGDHAFLLQNTDDRVTFVIPFHDQFTLIGTTEVAVTDAHNPQCSDEEARYLCDAVNRYFRVPVTVDSILWSYAGVRPLFDDGSSKMSRVTRDYALELDVHGAPILTVFGGKLTTYRSLSEKAVDKLRPWLPEAGPTWTATAPLPGGDMSATQAASLGEELARAHSAVEPATLRALLRRHGSRAREILEACGGDLGAIRAGNLTDQEAAWLVEHEWAKTDEDLLWRRTKAGLSSLVRDPDGR